MKKPVIQLLLPALLLVGVAGRAQPGGPVAGNAPLLEASRTDTTAFPRYRFLHVGLGSRALRDNLLSPLRYGGLVFGGNASVWKYKPRWLHASALSVTGGTLGNDRNGSTIFDLGVGYAYTWYRPLRFIKVRRLRVFAGGGPEAQVNFRTALGNVNNVLAYEAVLSASVGVVAQYPFRLFRRDWMLINQARLPVWSLLARPSYAWSVPLADGGTGQPLQMGFWNAYFRAQNQLSLDFYTRVRHKRKTVGRDAWRLTYAFDYQQVSQPNRVQIGTQLVTLAKIIRF